MKRELTIVRSLNAPRERVWQAWTDPKQLAQWWGPQGVSIPVSEIDLRVGGGIHIVMLAGEEMGPLAGQKWPMHGIFKEIIEFEKLAFSTTAVDDSGAILLTGETSVIFKEDGTHTELTIVTSAEGDKPGTEMMLQGMEPGWNQQLDKLTEIMR